MAYTLTRRNCTLLEYGTWAFLTCGLEFVPSHVSNQKLVNTLIYISVWEIYRLLKTLKYTSYKKYNHVEKFALGCEGHSQLDA